MKDPSNSINLLFFSCNLLCYFFYGSDNYQKDNPYRESCVRFQFHWECLLPSKLKKKKEVNLLPLLTLNDFFNNFWLIGALQLWSKDCNAQTLIKRKSKLMYWMKLST